MGKIKSSWQRTIWSNRKFCAIRLKPFGICVQNKTDAKYWFLKGKDDIRSSFYLEDIALEFEIQGLEIDWAIVAWDADFRFIDHKFKYYK